MLNKLYTLRAPRTRAPGLVLAVGLHVALIAVIWNYEPSIAAPSVSSPIMVSLITNQEEIVQPVLIPPEPVKPKIKPPPRPRPEKAVVLSAPSAAPAVYETAPPPEPVPEVAMAPKAEPAPIEEPYRDASYLDMPRKYPPGAQRAGEKGIVMVRALITPQGTVSKTELFKSSNFARLDQDALETVKKWKFVPGKQGNTPVEAWVKVPVNYNF